MNYYTILLKFLLSQKTIKSCIYSLIILGSIHIYTSQELYKKTFTESFITSHDGLSLYSLYMSGENSHDDSPVIVWVHGFSKHCQRFLPAMNYCAQQGFASIGYDVRGHGRSGGTRAHMDNWQQHIDDFISVCSYYKEKIAHKKLFIVSHSLGTIIPMRYIQESCNEVSKVSLSGIIATAPCFEPHSSVASWYKRSIASWIGSFFPTYSLSLKRKHSEKLTHDQELVLLDQKDPYIERSVTLGALHIGFEACQCAFDDAHKINVPLHILMAGDDQIVNNQKTCEFYNKLPRTLDKSMTVFEGMYHSMLQEVDRHLVYQKICEIIGHYSY